MPLCIGCGSNELNGEWIFIKLCSHGRPVNKIEANYAELVTVGPGDVVPPYVTVDGLWIGLCPTCQTKCRPWNGPCPTSQTKCIPEPKPEPKPENWIDSIEIEEDE